MKALIITTTPYMIRQFLMNDIKLLISLGYDVEVATNFDTFGVMSESALCDLKSNLLSLSVKMNQIDFTNKITQIGKIRTSYLQLKSLIEKNNYDLMHTHTPIAGFVSRFAFKNSSLFSSKKLIYTAHGFHFFKGNKFYKNLIFRSAEKFAARFTDAIITINSEDYAAAKKFRLKENGSVYFVPGVGINIRKMREVKDKRQELFEELGIDKNSVLLVSVGELNENKNHKMVIEALSKLPENFHYIVCGKGELLDYYHDLISTLNLNGRVHLIGFRTDVLSIVKSCDLFIFPSKREGLSVALMEAISMGTPCLASNIRGNFDLLKNYPDCLFHVNDKNELISKIKKMIENPVEINQEDITALDINNIQKDMKDIYLKVMQKM